MVEEIFFRRIYYKMNAAPLPPNPPIVLASSPPVVSSPPAVSSIPTMEIMGNDGHKYVFDSKEEKIYVTKYAKYSQWLFNGSMALLVIVVIYDMFKDTARTLSGYRDIFSGKSGSGAAKVMGYTRGNIMRGVVMGGLVVVAFLLNRYLESNKKQITERSIPRDVGEKYLIELGKILDAETK